MATAKGSPSTESGTTPPVSGSVEATRDTGTTPEEVTAQRTTDSDKPATDTYVRKYVVLKGWPGEDESHNFQDDANRENTVRDMIAAGLRPAEGAQPERVSVEDHPDGKHSIVTYVCKAVPSGLSMEADVIHVGPGGEVTRPVVRDATRDGDKDAGKDAKATP